MLTAQQGALNARVDLRIGSVDGENTALSMVGSIAASREGTVFVALPQEARLRVFDASGRFVRTIGGKGDGPGEFRSLSRMGWLADTLWVHDHQQRRVSFFRRSGEFITSVLMADMVRPDGITMISGVLQNGRVLAIGILSSDQMATNAPRTVPVVFANRDGTNVMEIARIGLGKFTVVTNRQGRATGLMSNKHVSLAFGDETIVRSAPEGAHVTVVVRPAATSSGKAKYRVTRYAPSGAVMWVREFDYTPQRVSTKHVDSLLALMSGSLVRSGDYPSAAAAVSGLRSQLPIPKFYAPVSDAHVGSDGSLWLRGPVLGSGPVEWTVLGPDGVRRRTVRIPPGVELKAIGESVAWGVEEDENGVPYVVRLRF
jgi:hypothetical protein